MESCIEFIIILHYHLPALRLLFRFLYFFIVRTDCKAIGVYSQTRTSVVCTHAHILQIKAAATLLHASNCAVAISRDTKSVETKPIALNFARHAMKPFIYAQCVYARTVNVKQTGFI